MITLTVTSFKGNPVANPPVSFDELGGTIGRADNNQLVLPDPERTISRIHAQVVFRGGSYALIGRGGNAVVHNGQPVGHGAEVMLAQGDQIVIGSYHITVATAAPAKADPFEAAFGRGGVPAPVARPTPAAARAAPSSFGPEQDTGPQRAVAAAGAGASGFGIPDDWDPFARDAASDPFGQILGASNAARAPAPGAGASPAAAFAAVPPTPSEDSIDALFGLGSVPASADPFVTSPLGVPAAQPNTAGSVDPLRALQQGAASVPARPESDHVSDLNAPWSNARAPAKPAAAPLPGAVLSWDLSSRVAKPATAAAVPQPAPPARAPAPTRTAAPALAAAQPAPVQQPVASAAPSPVAGEVELLEALKQGLGTPDLRLAALSPELMRQIGQLLRESTRGTVELLAARAALKREVRADVTTIIANANNSLKFSPSVEVALQYLLGPRMAGFMPPVESMRDAFDDLKAHQLGVMAGMKAALAGVLERFDPKVVEAKLTGGSALGSLIPSTRKARLWELFQDLYQKLATEAEEDFNTLFGAAFLKAYQEYIDQLEARESVN
ncbi:MAG: type VI secretion system-associated FHA domain protein TagH [Burkholderiaceae bacterium]